MNNRERLIKLLGCKYNCVDRNKCLEEQADYLLENDVVVPPVTIGQKVYYLGGMYNGIRPIRSGTIDEIVISSKGVSELWINGRNGIYYLNTKRENFYLTKEEAEKALKGQ